MSKRKRRRRHKGRGRPIRLVTTAPARRQPPPPPTSRRFRGIFAQIHRRDVDEIVLVPIARMMVGGAELYYEEGLPDLRGDESLSVFIDLAPDIADGCVELAARLVRVDTNPATRQPTVTLMWTSEDPCALARVLSLLEHERPRLLIAA